MGLYVLFQRIGEEMVSFQELFTGSRGQPIEYQGLTLKLVDEFPLDNSSRLRLTVEHIDSEWKQGLVLRTKGSFLVNNQKVPKSIVLWEDTAPAVIEIEVQSPDDHIKINNVWDHGDGVVQAWHHGAAMIVDEIPNGRRYRCNDGHPDDNFTDIVFRLERELG